MYFDTMSGIIERHLPQFIDTMKQAKLFRLDCDPPKNASAALERWQPDEKVLENFRLPFEHVAIEYANSRESSGNSCVVLSRFGPPENRQFRFLVGRGHDDADIAAGLLTALPHGELEIAVDDVKLIHRMQLWSGTKKSGVEPQPCDLRWLVRPYEQVVEDDDQYIDRTDKVALMERATECRQKANQLTVEMAGCECTLAVLAVIVINEPAKFVVEERTESEPRLPPTTIRRSAGRAQFVVLTPKQIRQRFIWTEKEGDTPDDGVCKVTPHERRGHFRHLQSERFRSARGQVIWIKPMWVGPSEGVRDGKRYKVRLDL